MAPQVPPYAALSGSGKRLPTFSGGAAPGYFILPLQGEGRCDPFRAGETFGSVFRTNARRFTEPPEKQTP